MLASASLACAQMGLEAGYVAETQCIESPDAIDCPPCLKLARMLWTRSTDRYTLKRQRAAACVPPFICCEKDDGLPKDSGARPYTGANQPA